MERQWADDDRVCATLVPTGSGTGVIALTVSTVAARVGGSRGKQSRGREPKLVPGVVVLDNNATERGIRGPIVGRRNHFDSKSERGTQVAATFYSLIETAKLHGVDPAAYLLEAARAHERGEVLLPSDLVQTQSTAE